MSKKNEISVESHMISLEKAQQILAWWDRKPTEGSHIALDGRSTPWVTDGNYALLVKLTPAVVEEIRDQVTPWTVVARCDVRFGETFMRQGLEFTALPSRPNDNNPRMCWHWDTLNDEQVYLYGTTEVLVRRSVNPYTDLGHLNPKQKFRFVKECSQLTQGECIRTDCGWVTTSDWSHYSFIGDASGVLDTERWSLRQVIVEEEE